MGCYPSATTLRLLPFLAVLEFMPFKGDLLLMEYVMDPGTTTSSIKSASALNSQNMEEVSDFHVARAMGR